MIGGKEDRRIGGQEDGRTIGQAERRTWGQEDRTTGDQEDDRTWGQDSIPIDVHVLHPAVIVLKLIYSVVNVQIDPWLNCIGTGFLKATYLYFESRSCSLKRVQVTDIYIVFPSCIVFLGTLCYNQLCPWKSTKGDKAKLFMIYF